MDPSLEGYVVKCRKSQLKYCVPLKCINHLLNDTDDYHEQIEISSFCKSQETKLNVRAIQILEHYAELASKSNELECFLMNCVNDTISEFEIIANGCRDTLYKKIKRINLQNDKTFDAIILSRMSAANVDHNDPEFHRRCSKLLCCMIFCF